MQGLLVNEKEYLAVFAHHQDVLDVTSIGPFKRLSSRQGACPNWQGACTVYDNRPMECRLFPFTVSLIAATSKTVRLTLHDRVDCPQKVQLRPSPETAICWVTSFAHQAYGTQKRVRITFERGWGKVTTTLLRLALRLRLIRP